MTVIDHGDSYELCNWEGGIYLLSDAMKGLDKSKPIWFTVDPNNKAAIKFYRGLLAKGKIAMVRMVFELVDRGDNNG